jgi:hypothetical protein
MSLSTLSMIADFVAWICIWGGQTHCISFSWSELLYCNQLLRMCTRSFSGIFLNIHGSGRFRKFHCTYQPSIYRYLVLLQGTLLGESISLATLWLVLPPKWNACASNCNVSRGRNPYCASSVEPGSRHQITLFNPIWYRLGIQRTEKFHVGPTHRWTWVRL